MTDNLLYNQQISMNVLRKLITAMSLCQNVSILKDLTIVPVSRKTMLGMKVPALVKIYNSKY